MNALEIKGLSKKFGDVQALDNVDLTVKKGNLMVLLGPTGAGKTTLQRLVAGLEKPDCGQVLIDGQDMADCQPNQRDVSMVFESLALYPNLTAYENMAHPLRIRGSSDAEIKAEVGKLAEILHVSHILDRKPASFSGGEKQRIAIGRALAKPAMIYLLDEPLSSLDALLRTGLRSEMKRLLAELGHSFIFATPDYTEALALGDNVNIMMDGKILQGGAASDLYETPATTEIATFVGNPPMNLLPAQVAVVGGDTKAQIGAIEIQLPKGAPQGDDLIIGVRPEHLKVATEVDVETATTFNATIIDQEPLGNRSTLVLQVKDSVLTTSVDTEDDLHLLTSVSVTIDPARFHYFSSGGGRLSSGK